MTLLPPLIYSLMVSWHGHLGMDVSDRQKTLGVYRDGWIGKVEEYILAHKANPYHRFCH